MNPLPDLSQLAVHGQGRQTITLHDMSEKLQDIPINIKEKLIKKSMEIQEGVKNKDEAVIAAVNAPTAIKVPYFD